ncbi:MAG: class I SAM-dependent methyltransferase [Acidisphaera sp.]|nr:class I SAM-dependent methyltransferase [Acidisphaera sp.]
MSGSMEDPVQLCLDGRISPEVALARLTLGGMGPGAIRSLLERAGPPAAALSRRLADSRGGLERLAGMLEASGLDHAAGETGSAAITAIRDAFDRAVARSPEASVAAYSLGEPAILAAATGELLAWLTREGLLGTDRDVVDLGCGIGRIAAAAAPHVRSVLGLDVSPGMVTEARRRHAEVANLRFAVTDGQGLDGPCCDLLLAVDSFPYLVQAGMAVAERHVADAARILRPGGALAICNLSYRGDLDADRATAACWAARHGFELVRNGAAPFTLWDGTAFLLRKPLPPSQGAHPGWFRART